MHFFEPSVITDQPKFQLSLTLHALLSLASSPSFSCLYRGRFLRQLTSIDECIFSFPQVEGVHLDDVLDGFDLSEVESLRSDGSIVLNFDNLGIFLENNAEVVFNRCEALVGHFDHSVREKIHHVL